MIKEYLKKFWTWLLDQTQVDEKIEENVNDIKEDIIKVADEVESRYGRVKEEIRDVKEAAAEVVNQIDDVAKAIGGSERKGRKPKKQSKSKSNLNTNKPSVKKITKTSLRTLTKQDLIKQAKKDFNVSLDPKLTKSNLVNKLYELNHKK